ncbi:MAG TPA: 3-deoxy-7-phosphoheptulonate synthase, partial [Terriglobales bacterium]|nr:3-deoxy-7-phosphoheptulonate synthase [Terriglobales bacterium]
LHAMISARHPHSFLGINGDGLTAIIKTNGNPDRHVILRGGGGKTNYSPEDVKAASALVQEEGIVRPVMIDCSHGNSRKEYARQIEVAGDVIEQVAAGATEIMGLMLESNIHPGAQPWKPGATLQYGVSITDSCIGWEDTERLLMQSAARLAL